MNYCTEKLFFS